MFKLPILEAKSFSCFACSRVSFFSRYHRKNNGFPILDILGYLKNTHKIPNLGEWDKSQSGNSQPSSQIGICLTLPNLGFLWVFFKYTKISKIGNPLFFPVYFDLRSSIVPYGLGFQMGSWLLSFSEVGKCCLRKYWKIYVVLNRTVSLVLLYFMVCGSLRRLERVFSCTRARNLHTP